MKNVKKALLATSLAGALVVSAGYGTYSWFTSSTQAVGAIDNGTLSVNNGEAISTELFSGESFAPSQYVLGNFVTLDNTGSMDQQLKVTYTGSVDKASADPYKIYYLAYKYKEKPSGDVMKNFRQQWEKGFFNGNHNPSMSLAKSSAASLPEGVEVVTGEATVEEAQAMAAMAKSSEGSSKTYKIGNDKFFKLKPDQYIDIVFDVKLDQNAGNEYQGAIYSGNLNVQAKQTDQGAKFENKK
jgi:spore coat-associated protein N